MNLCFKFINPFFFSLSIIITLLNTYLLKNINFIETIPNQIKQNYFQLNLLSSGKTLILDDDIICSYNSEFSSRIMNNNNNNNIICLEKYQYIYIINNADKYLYKFNLDNLRKNNEKHFNLIPYSFNNDIFFIISYINYNNNELNMIQYQIKINEHKCYKINAKIFVKKEISSFKYPLNCTVSTNDNIKSNLFICFFLDQQKIYSFTFDIKREFNEININNIICQDCLERGYYSYYSDISINQRKNIIFLCYKININKDKNSHCLFYYIRNNYFKEIQHIITCDKYLKNYYFSETKEYSIICQDEGLILNKYTLNTNNIDNNYFITSIDTRNFNCQNTDNFFLYLNSSKKEYNLINDCTNNHDFVYLSNISYKNNSPYIINVRSTEENTDIINEDFLSKSFDDKKAFLNNYFIDKNKEYYIEYHEDNFITNFYETKKKKPKSVSLNLSECESILRNETNLNSSKIILLQIETYDTSKDSLINKVDYILFYENGTTKIDLTKCENVKVLITYQLKKNTSADLNKASTFNEFGINIFNESDIFFNEFCHVYPDFENDIIMEDRIKDVYQKFKICEPGCTFININVKDINNPNVTCECDIKNSFDIDSQIPERKYEFKNYFLNKSTNNFEILKCFGLVFSFKYIYNLGFYIFAFLLGAHVPLWIHYINTGIKPIHNFILYSMKEYGYIENNKKNIHKNLSNKKGKKGKKDSIKNKTNNKGINNSDINHKNTSMPPPKNKNLDKNKENNVDEKKSKKRKNKSSKLKNNLIEENKEKQLGIKDIKIKNRNNKKSAKLWNKHTQNNYNTIIFTSNEVFNKKIGKKKQKLNKKTTDVDIKSDKSEDIMNSKYIYDYNDFDEEDYKKEKIGINLINIKVNDTKDRNIKPNESNKILNNYNFKEAIKYDKRSYCRIFYIFLLSKQIIFHLFSYESPLELMSVRAFVVLFVYSNHLAFNAIFYFNSNVSKKYYSNEGLVSFTFNTNMGIIFLSSFLSIIFNILITKLSNPTLFIREIFRKEEDKLKSDKKYIVTKKRKDEILKEVEKNLVIIKKKFLALFITEIVIMLFFWYYLTAFGHIYSNTQYSWILNCFISIVIHFILELIFCMIVAILYKISINNKINSLYNFVMFLYNYV